MNNYFDTDQYFDFDSPPTSKSKKKNQQQQVILLLLLAAGAAYYYFMIYLPEEEVKKLEKEIQEKLEEVKKIKSEEFEKIPTMLGTLENYLSWVNGNEIQKVALSRQKDSLDKAIYWLKKNQETKEQTKERLENEAFKKGRLWELPIKSWADKEVKKMAKILVGRYQEDAKMFPQGDKDKNLISDIMVKRNKQYKNSI